MPDSTLPPPIRTEILSEHMHVDFWESPAIVSYTFKDIHLSTVDLWYNHYTAYLTAISSPQNSRAIFDTSANGVTFTPYVRRRATSIAKDHHIGRQLYGYAAFVVSDRLLQLTLELFMKGATRPYVRYKAFMKYDEALKWLIESQDHGLQQD